MSEIWGHCNNSETLAMAVTGHLAFSVRSIRTHTFLKALLVDFGDGVVVIAQVGFWTRHCLRVHLYLLLRWFWASHSSYVHAWGRLLIVASGLERKKNLGSSKQNKTVSMYFIYNLKDLKWVAHFSYKSHFQNTLLGRLAAGLILRLPLSSFFLLQTLNDKRRRVGDTDIPCS